MTKRDSDKDRKECFNAHKKEDERGRVYLVCHICGGPINPANPGALGRWVADHHPVTFANGGKVCEPAHEICHRGKTAKDVSTMAKGKRVSLKHFGIVRPKGFYRPKGAKFDWRRGRYVREEEDIDGT